MATNRNFDSRIVIQRLQNQVIANNTYRSQKNGKTILANPQNSNPSGLTIVDYDQGVQTTFQQGPNGGYTVSLGGIADQLNTVQPVQPILPAPPTNLIANPGDQIATIFFTPGSQGSSPITNYEYSIDGGITFVAFSPAQTTSPVTISGLTNGTQYIVALKTVTSLGSSPSSLTTNVTPATVPSAPTNLSAIPGNNQVTITFIQSSDGGSAITDYQYSINSGLSWNFIGATSSPVTITGLTNGTVYSIQLRALNGIGPSDSSSTFSIAPIGSFSPASIATMNLWLDPQNSSKVIQSSGSVSSVTDSSTAGNDFTANNSGIVYAQPSNINSRPALNFTTSAPSTSTYLGKDNFNIAPTNELTLFMVTYQTSKGGPPGNSELFFTRNNYQYFDLFNNTNSVGLLSTNVGNTQTYSTTNIYSPPTIAIISVVLTTTTVTVYVNGTVTTINGTSRGGGFSLNDSTLDWTISGGAFLGNMGDVITYTTPLITLNRQQVEGYLAWKWGTQSELPNNHPYKNAPPTGPPSGNYYNAPQTNTNVTSIPQSPFIGGGNSYNFNGSDAWLSLPSDDSWAFGTDDFTIEWFQYETDNSPFTRIFQIGAYPDTSIGCSIESGTFYAWFPDPQIATDITPYKNAWHHFAIVRQGSTLTAYKDGTQFGTEPNSNNITNSGRPLYIGAENGGSSGTFFGGYITNMRIVKGLAVYTGNFTVPTSALTQTASANPYGGSNTQAIPDLYTKLLLVPMPDLNILILGDSQATLCASSLQSAKTALGYTNILNITTKDVFGVDSAYTGSDLSSYNVVILYTNGGATPSSTLGTNLNSYVAGGGNLIMGVFAWGNVTAFPNLDYTNYSTFVYAGTQSYVGSQVTYPVSNPITATIPSSGIVISSSYTASIALTSGATAIVTFTPSGENYIAVKESGSARMVGINSYLGIDYTGSTNQAIMKYTCNSIYWCENLI